MDSNNIIIFCQAPADIPYVLKLYEQYKDQSQISIFVINVEGMFRFLSDLKLDIEKLIFIPYKLIDVRQIGRLNAERKRINYLWQTHFLNVIDGKVYFFSRFEDWLTGAFIHRFTKNIRIKTFYLDHYDDQAMLFPEQKFITFKRKVYLFLLKFLTDVAFEGGINEKLPEFPVDKYPILKLSIEVDKEIFFKYSYDFKSLNTFSNLLFFVSPCEITMFKTTVYNEKIIELIGLFKTIGFKIIVKGHPRMGMPQEIREIADFEIPCYVPGEFINTRDFKMCVGIDTTAICYFAEKRIMPTYSLIKLFPSINNELINIYIQYLLKQSKDEMLFIDNIEKLKKIALTYL